MKKRTPLRTATFILFAASSACWAAEEPGSVRLDEKGDCVVLDVKHLKPLVARLEERLRLKKENARLDERVKLLEDYGGSLEEELSVRKEAFEELRASLSSAEERRGNAEKRTALLAEEVRVCGEINDEGKNLSIRQEEEINGLRRRLDGGTMIIWAVSTVGGALLLLVLL